MPGRRRAAGLVLLFGILTAASVSAREGKEEKKQADPADPEMGRVVRCVLPDRLVRQGRRQAYLVPRKPERLTALECEIRNGRYVAWDEADLETALGLWSSRALAGDAEAQYYVGEIFERGLGVPPDYREAATWYRKAADQGHARAGVNLAHLYEKGLGVERDVLEALKLYRAAAGLTGAIAIDSHDEVIDLAELERLRGEVERHRQESEELRRRLERLEREKLDSAADLAAARDRERELLADLAAARTREEELGAEIAARESDSQRLEQAARELRAETRRLQDELAGAGDKVAELTARLAEQGTALEEQRVEVVRRDDLSRSLQARLARFERSRTERARQIQVAAGSIAGPTIVLTDPLHLRASERLELAVGDGGEKVLVGRVTAPAGVIRAFTVNDEPHPVGESGLFKVTVSTGETLQRIELAVVDGQGKDARLVVDLLPEVAPRAGEADQMAALLEPGPSFALIVANQSYRELSTVETARADGRRLAEVLERRYGFRIRVLTDVTRTALLAALNRLQQELGEDENLLLYYAGHGRLDEATGQGFWLPVDARPGEPSGWISLADVTERLGEVAARHVLVITDSSSPAVLNRSAIARLEPGLEPAARRERLRQIAAGRSRTVLSSGALRPLTDAGDTSIFAAAILRVLDANPGVLEAKRLYDFVAAQMGLSAERIGVDLAPHYAPMRLSGHEAGDFLFVPRQRPSP